jgi:hypothetical protein
MRAHAMIARGRRDGALGQDVMKTSNHCWGFKSAASLKLMVSTLRPVSGRSPGTILRLATLATAALLLAGCGISFGGGTSSELFSKLSLEGEPVVGGQMTLEVTYEQRYPLPVDISCFLVESGRSRRLLGRDTLSADPDTSVEPTPVAGSSTFRFRVDRPGRYLALCNTPLDPENFISEEFQVK